jgi:hypothetical protein
VTIAELTAILQSTQAAANTSPTIALNPYAQIGFLASNALLSIVAQMNQNANVDRPETFSEEAWLALSAFSKSGDAYIAAAQLLNPLDPSKIRPPVTPPVTP